MLDIRECADIEAVREMFRDASEIALKLKCGKPEEIAPCFFDIPIFCCLIHGNFDTASALPRSCFQLLGGKQGSYFDAHAKVLSAFVLQDDDIYGRMVADFRELPSNYWWSKQLIYFDFYAAVMRRDQGALNRLLIDSQNEFEKRAADK